jgi:hypothetical protein
MRCCRKVWWITLLYMFGVCGELGAEGVGSRTGYHCNGAGVLGYTLCVP